MTRPEPTAAAVALRRVAALEDAFREIARTRMRGLPLLNPRLSVQALGFAAEPGGGATGVLLTPWFMNLVRLPAADAAVLGVGETTVRELGPRRFDFVGAFEPGVGAYEASSLFSPMFEFADQAAAVATAHEVLARLRPTPPGAPVPSRRGFLSGRVGAAP